MGQQYLIDSNTVIDYLSGKLPENGKIFMSKIINEIPNISVITKIEVVGYRTTPEAEQLLTGFVNDSVLFGLTDDIIEQTIQVRKEYKLKIPDAIIAATGGGMACGCLPIKSSRFWNRTSKQITFRLW